MFGQMAAMLLPAPAETVGQQLLLDQGQAQQREQEGIELASHSGFAHAQPEGSKTGTQLVFLIRRLLRRPTFAAQRGCEKIGTGTFAPADFPEFSPCRLGVSPIFSQPQRVPPSQIFGLGSGESRKRAGVGM